VGTGLGSSYQDTEGRTEGEWGDGRKRVGTNKKKRGKEENGIQSSQSAEGGQASLRWRTREKALCCWGVGTGTSLYSLKF
jgi:hypothetical protein